MILDAENPISAAEAVFGRQPSQVKTFTHGVGTAPRQTCRIYFDSETVMATRRTREGVAEIEMEILRRLRSGGAAVPRVLGHWGGWFFQEDLGPETLSQWLNFGSAKPIEDGIGRAIEELHRIWTIGNSCNLVRIVPTLEGDKWAAALSSELVPLAEAVGVPRRAFAPSFLRRFCEILSPTGTDFIRWDARPANAARDHDGRIWWFDFEHSACHWVLDDIVWLVCDETVPDEIESDVLLDRACTAIAREQPSALPAAALEYAACLAIFHCFWRLTRVTSTQYAGLGARWEDTIIEDWPGSIVAARRLCRRGHRMASLTPFTKPFANIFEELLQRF